MGRLTVTFLEGRAIIPAIMITGNIVLNIVHQNMVGSEFKKRSKDYQGGILVGFIKSERVIVTQSYILL
jgi:hypothetical protein